MARLYKVIGLVDNEVAIEVDGKGTCTFDLNENIQASKVFESLDYHAGDSYGLDVSNRGKLDEQKYESCKTFFKQIVDKVNEVFVSDENTEEASETGLDGEDNTSEEDTPF